MLTVNSNAHLWGNDTPMVTKITMGIQEIEHELLPS